MSKRGQRKQITQGDPDPMDDDSGGEDEQVRLFFLETRFQKKPSVVAVRG